jgi:hypothetical protein
MCGLLSYSDPAFLSNSQSGDEPVEKYEK